MLESGRTCVAIYANVPSLVSSKRCHAFEVSIVLFTSKTLFLFVLNTSRIYILPRETRIKIDEKGCEYIYWVVAEYMRGIQTVNN